MFTLTIETDNAAFEDMSGNQTGREIARLLREAAKRIEAGEHDGKLLDSNGNTVGQYQ